MHGLQLVSRQHQLLHACCSIEGTLPHLLDPIIAQVSGRRGQKRENQVDGGSSATSSLILDSQLLCSLLAGHSFQQVEKL